MASDAAPVARAGGDALAPDHRRGVALCLSGGGYRAALFHLGSLRRLNELGVLAKVDTITSVSGGSILAGFLAHHLAEGTGSWPPESGIVPEWERGVAAPMRAMARSNIRTRTVLSRFGPNVWRRRHGFENALAAQSGGRMADLAFRDLPQRPRFVMCATDLEFGDQWVFDSGHRRLGSSKAGYLHEPSADWTLLSAVAASCCVPYLCPPVRVKGMAEHFQGGSYRADDRPARVARIDLTDGGMFDNLGLEPVWRDHAVLLVSDGAPTYATVQNARPTWRGLRQFIILLDQATDVRRRWLLSSIAHQELRGTRWQIGTVPHGDDAGQSRRRYSDHIVDEYISRTRIDLDSFSQGEIAVIENHGYLTTDVAIGRDFDYLSGGIRPPAAPPHPEWMEEDRARQALRNSSKVTLLGRGLVPVRPRGS